MENMNKEGQTFALCVQYVVVGHGCCVQSGTFTGAVCAAHSCRAQILFL